MGTLLVDEKNRVWAPNGVGGHTMISPGGGGAADFSTLTGAATDNASLAAALSAKADLVAGKVPVSQMPSAVLGGLNYQGTYNAVTNTPAIVAGNKGFYWKVATAGTSLGHDFAVGDWAVDNGVSIDKVDGNEHEVLSVAGRTGNVTLTSVDISDLAALLAAKRDAFIAPRTEGATLTLAASDNGGISNTPVSCVVTVNTGLGLGFGRGFIGNGAVSFAGTAAPVDKRKVDATATPVCALVCMGLDVYWAIGSKAA
jgi:hypothetical protein